MADTERAHQQTPSARPPQSWSSLPAPPSGAPHKVPGFSIHLFDPSRLLAVVIVLFWPLRYFAVVLVPALLLAVLTLAKHYTDIVTDLRRLLEEFDFLLPLLFSMVTVSLGLSLTRGAIIRTFGGRVRDLRLVMVLGVIPRLNVDETGIAELDRRGHLWVYGGLLLARLGFFTFGILLWATYRVTGSGFADLALLISQAGFWTFLIAAMPLLPSDGYHWLATYFGQPLLKEKAILALYCRLTRRPMPPIIRRRDVPLLVLFAVSTIVVTLAAALGFLILIGLVLAVRLQGLGAIMLLVAVAYCVVRVISIRSSIAQGRLRPRDGAMLRSLIAAYNAPAEPEPEVEHRGLPQWIGWAAGAIALIGVGLLPYSYEPAGPFEILPGKRSAATALIAGEVVSVSVREGDWVKAGQVVAQLSSWDQQSDVDLAREELQRAQQRLAKPEASRAADTGTASDEPAMREEIERLTQRLRGFEASLDNTKLRAPAEGRVTTPDVQLKIGLWLRAGQEFLQIDDTRTFEARIDIASGDIGLVRLGEAVRLRPWAVRGGEISGRVLTIGMHAEAAAGDDAPRPPVATEAAVVDPQVLQTRIRALIGSEAAEEQKEEAEVDVRGIRVIAAITGPGTDLRPGMRGFAKLEGREMRLWTAYLRLFVRVFTVEVWSWIP